MPPMTGRVIAGRYSLQQPIGRGAMGVVWRARDQLLDREVAVKEVLITALIGEDERRNAYQRTLREARTAARLSHRGVVAIYDVAEEDGRPWIIMELIEARSLDQVLTVEGRLSPLRAGRLGQQLLYALAHAHACGVLHRDVKPSNVLIAGERSGPQGWDERAVLTDFGIAQFEGDPRLTQTGMVMGSPGFTAPERIRGGQAMPASDLWSLGATLYTAVEGRGPYDGRGGPITTMSAIIHEDAPVAPHAGRLGPLIGALLRRDPAVRPSALAAARMFADVLPHLAAAADGPPAAHPPTVRSAHVPAPTPPLASRSAAQAPPAPADPAPPAAPAQAAEADEGVVSEPAAGAADVALDEPALGAEAVGAASDAAVSVAAVNGDLRQHNLDDEASDDGPARNAEPAAAEPALPAQAPAEQASVDAAHVAEASGAAETVVQSHTDEAPDTAEPALEQVPAEPVADQSPAAAAAAVVGAAREGAADTPDERPSAQTRIDSDPMREQTALSIPVAKSAPPAPPAPPKPTFTAASPADRRATPSFSAAQVPPPAVPPTEAHPGYGSGSRGASPYGGAGSSYGGSGASGTTPFAGSGAGYAGPSAQYPDLAQQYTPGTGGGRAQRPRWRGRRIVLLAAAIVLAAGIGAGAGLALRGNPSTTASTNTRNNVGNVPLRPTVAALDDPSGSIPSGWTQVSEPPQKTGTTAGFSIGMPPGWQLVVSGLTAHLEGPDNAFMEIDLTQHTYRDMLAEARFIKQQDLGSGKFPRYHQHYLIPQQVRGTAGAFWQFTWVPQGGQKIQADDILFILNTPAGAQSYAIYFRSPDALWSKRYIPIFEKMLRTFHTVPEKS